MMCKLIGLCVVSKHYIINLLCIVLFIYTTGNLLLLYIQPSLLHTEMEKQSLANMTFPFIFKICVKPGYKASMLNSLGYEDVIDYFEGMGPGDSFVGWEGPDGQVNATGSFHNFSRFPIFCVCRYLGVKQDGEKAEGCLESNPGDDFPVHREELEPG